MSYSLSDLFRIEGAAPPICEIPFFFYFSHSSVGRLSDFPFTFHALEKEMATHSGVLAWRIPGTGEPGGLLSMGSHRVGHDRSDLATAAAVFLPEEFHGQRSLEGYST